MKGIILAAALAAALASQAQAQTPASHIGGIHRPDRGGGEGRTPEVVEAIHGALKRLTAIATEPIFAVDARS
jgi:hypothetical protein